MSKSVTTYYDSDTSGNFELYSCDVDGTNVVQLTNDAAYDSFWPKAKPDGTQLLFCRVPAGTGTGGAAYPLIQYWTCGLDGSNATLRWGNPAAQSYQAQGTPNWHPTLDEVCHFVKASSAYTVRTLDTTTDTWTALSTRTSAGAGANAIQVDTAYTRDGTQIIFCDYRTGDNAALYNTSIAMVDRSGSADAGLTRPFRVLVCSAATTANITLSGTQTIDGVSVTAGLPVLVKNQTTGSENGVYVCAAGAWSRATWADSSAEFLGQYVWVYAGTVNANRFYEFASDTAPTVGTDSISYTNVTSTGRVAYAASAVVQYPNDPSLSPDGTTIAFLQKVDNSHSGVGNWDIKTIPVGGGRITTVIGDDNINSKPAWLTDETILFHRLRWGTDSTFGCWRIQSDGTAVTRYVTDGEYPEVPFRGAPGIDSLKVEFGFGYTPTETGPIFWTDVSPYVQQLRPTRGRTPQLGATYSGTATFVLKNQDYRFDPDNSTGPYVDQLVPCVPVRVTGYDSSGVQYRLFYGYVAPRDGWQQNYTATTATTTVQCVDFLSLLGTMTLPSTRDVIVYTRKILDLLGQLQIIQIPITVQQAIPTYQGYKAGALLSQLLSDATIPSPTPGWNVESTIYHIQGYFGGSNVTQWVQALAATEGGAVYVTRDGVIQFDGRLTVTTSSRMTTSQVTFDDSGSNVPFSVDGFAKTYAHEIVNKATITPDNGGAPYTVSDSTSIAAFTQTDFAAGGLYETGADCLAQADFIVQQYKSPVSCPATVRLKVRRSDTVLDAALHRELRDRATVKRQPPGATAQVTSSVFVEQIAHDINLQNRSWDCDLTFLSADTIAFAEGVSYFVLGSSLLGGGDKLGF